MTYSTECFKVNKINNSFKRNRKLEGQSKKEKINSDIFESSRNITELKNNKQTNHASRGNCEHSFQHEENSVAFKLLECLHEEI